METLINKALAPLWKRTPLKIDIPLNISGEVASGSGLTWDKLSHTTQFINNMTKNWN